MIQFHDYDVQHPFSVSETHTVENGKVDLNYAPLKGSVSIEGYTEDTTGKLTAASFFIDYDEENNYRAANQIVKFSPDAEGKTVNIIYRGVSTLLRAKHLNEVKDFMERGASEMAANMMVAHESALIDYFDDKLNGVTAAIDSVREAVIKAAVLGGVGGEIVVDDSLVATDEEFDAMLDEIFPVDDEHGQSKPSTEIDESMVATDEEFDSMLDEIFP